MEACIVNNSNQEFGEVLRGSVNENAVLQTFMRRNLGVLNETI